MTVAALTLAPAQAVPLQAAPASCPGLHHPPQLHTIDCIQFRIVLHMRMKCACKTMRHTVLGGLHAGQCSCMSCTSDIASGVCALILNESHESHRAD